MDATRSPLGWSRLVSVCLGLAAVLPFAAAVAFHAAGAVAQPVAAAVDRPGLAFQQYLVNLREISPVRETSARFAFKNVGQGPVHVTALEPSCGCLKPRLDKRTYAPGESGMFHLRVQTATEKPGPKEYSIIVRYTDPEPREAKLLFKVRLPERNVLVEPPGLIFYQLGAGAGAETQRDLFVTDFRPRKLTIERAEVSTPLATAEVAETAADADGHQRTRIVVTVPAEVPPGTHRALVTIHTDDTDFPQIHVPLLIERQQGASLRGETPDGALSGAP